MYEYKVVEAHSRADFERELEHRADEGWEISAFHMIARKGEEDAEAGAAGLYAALVRRRKPLVETF